MALSSGAGSHNLLSIHHLFPAGDTHVRNNIGEKQPLLSEINRRKLMYFSHIRRREGNNLEKAMVEGMVAGHHSRG